MKSTWITALENNRDFCLECRGLFLEVDPIEGCWACRLKKLKSQKDNCYMCGKLENLINGICPKCVFKKNLKKRALVECENPEGIPGFFCLHCYMKFLTWSERIFDSSPLGERLKETAPSGDHQTLLSPLNEDFKNR